MKGISFSSMRVGETYRLINYGERYEFTLLEIVSASEFLLKDTSTLETYRMSDLVRFGKGKDFEIQRC